MCHLGKYFVIISLLWLPLDARRFERGINETNTTETNGTDTTTGKVGDAELMFAHVVSISGFQSFQERRSVVKSNERTNK